MIKPAEFSVLVERAMAENGQGHMRPVIEKELLHYDILFALDNEGLLDNLTFQGGTSLRLCYGSSRFSEDLDFAGGRDFSSGKLKKIKGCLEEYISKRYKLEVYVKEPAELKEQDDKYSELKVDKWQIVIVTSPSRRDIPKQKIKVEIANIPAYSHEAKALNINYDFLPDGYGDVLVMTETLDEIMADKLISLVNTVRYVRHRDIWDLRWLKQKGAHVNMQWVKNKIVDYQVSDYIGKLDAMKQQLPEIIHSQAFKDEIVRFIPVDVQQRTINKDKFLDFLVLEIQGLLDVVKAGIDT